MVVRCGTRDNGLDVVGADGAAGAVPLHVGAQRSDWCILVQRFRRHSHHYSMVWWVCIYDYMVRTIAATVS